MLNDSYDFGTAFQRQFKRGIGLGGDPVMESKRNRQDPAPKGWGGSGLEDTPPGTESFMGGGGGSMPIPNNGTGWRQGVGDLDGWAGFRPMPFPDRGDQNGGGGGPMPMPPPWKGKNPEDFGVTMEFGGPGAVNPVGMGPQDLRNLYNPQPMPPRPNPQMSQPPAWGGGRPGLGGGLVDSWNGPVGDLDRTPTPMPFPPAHQGGGSAYLGGPRRQVQPSSFDFNNMGAQPQNGWKWGDMNNLRRRRF